MDQLSSHTKPPQTNLNVCTGNAAIWALPWWPVLLFFWFYTRSEMDQTYGTRTVSVCLCANRKIQQLGLSAAWGPWFMIIYYDGLWSSAHLSFWDLWGSLWDAIHSVGSGGRDLGLTSLRISRCGHEFLFQCWSGYIESTQFLLLHHSRVNQKKSLVGCASALPSFLFERTAKPGGNLRALYSLSDFNLSALKKEGRNKESHM